MSALGRGERAALVFALALTLALSACGSTETRRPVVVTITASAVGAEAEILEKQLARFEAAHPTIAVERRITPDSADVRHQLYVQWLNAGSRDPDVLQIDVIWTPELAAAGWLLPLDEGRAGDDWFDGALEANRWRGKLHALPWFVDVGMLYWRTDLLDRAPRTFDELEDAVRIARTSSAPIELGLVLQAARYEGLVTVFLEYVKGFGGEILDRDGVVRVSEPAAVRALEALLRQVEQGVIPQDALSWREEESRLAFQNGRALFMRNWPYAAALLADPERSAVAGRFAVAPMPRDPGGTSAAALGGAQLAINASTEHPKEALALIEFLTAPAQMIERAEVIGQYPPRPSLYEGETLSGAFVVPPAEVLNVVARATPRPATPLWTELSQHLQAGLHRSLTGQAEPQEALNLVAEQLQRSLDRAELDRAGTAAPSSTSLLPPLFIPIAIFFALVSIGWAIGRRPRDREEADARLGRWLVLPALLGIVGLALLPLGLTGWESLHLHDLRMPWRGQPFVGARNYVEAAGDPRLLAALGHTVFFTVSSVALEILLGLVLALALQRAFRGRGVARTIALLPWAIPTVVAALLARVIFAEAAGWLADPVLAWVPVILADVWKTTPFVALLLLAGLESIDPSVYEAARIDGASPWQELTRVTLPLLLPVMLVAVLFRTLDAIRVFDLVYVLTGGGPGTATEPIALYTFNALLEHLRFGYGSALAVIVFAAAAVMALIYVRILGKEPA